MSVRWLKGFGRPVGFVFFGGLWTVVLLKLSARRGWIDLSFVETFLYVPGLLIVPLAALSLGFSHFLKRKVLTLASLMLLLVLLGPVMEFRWSSRSENPASMRVVSLNTHSYTANVSEVATALRILKPDVLLLQEVWLPSHIEAIEAELPDFQFRGDRTWFDGDGVYVGTKLKSSPGLSPRPRYAATALLLGSNSETLVVSVHGTKRHGISPSTFQETLRVQRQQCNDLMHRVRESDSSLLVGGDFNAPVGGTFSGIEKSGLHDAFEKAGRGYGYTFPSILPMIRLDRVLYSPDILEPLDCFVEDVGSDHLAVVADFRFR